MAHTLKEQILTRFSGWVGQRVDIRRIQEYSKLDFDALMKKAESLLKKKTNGGESKITFERPDYYPKPGWFRRTMLSVGNGLLLYASVCVVILATKFGGVFLVGGVFLLIPLISVLCHTMKKFLKIMESETGMKEGEPVARVIFFPILEPFFLFWNITARCYHVIDLITRFFKDSKKNKNLASPKQEEVIRSIPQMVVEIIREESDRVFGTVSSYASIHTKIASRLDSARKVKAYFEKRIKESDTTAISQRLLHACERARESCKNLEHELKRLESWKAAICVEFDAYCMKVNGISPELEDIVHYRELDLLEREIDLLREEAEQEIVKTTMELLGSVSNRCAHLNSTLREASMRSALAAATTGDTEKDLTIFTETIDALYIAEPKINLVAASQ